MKKGISPLEGQTGRKDTLVGGRSDSAGPRSAPGVQPATPSQKVGLEVHNGSGQHFMSSDAAPALDTSISPVWTGSHDFRGATITVPMVSPSDNEQNAASTAFVASRIRQPEAKVVNSSDHEFSVTIDHPLTIVRLTRDGQFSINFDLSEDHPITYGKVIVASYNNVGVDVWVHPHKDNFANTTPYNLHIKFANKACMGSFEVIRNTPKPGVILPSHYLCLLYGFIPG